MVMWNIVGACVSIGKFMSKRRVSAIRLITCLSIARSGYQAFETAENIAGGTYILHIT